MRWGDARGVARELNRRQAHYGLEIMCTGGGQGLAAVFERVAST
jgi:acetyl-CoA C-acetyltransferase